MKFLAIFAATSGMLSVILGAFAAHGLKSKLPVNLLNAFETGVQYQFYHSLAILLVVLLCKQLSQPLMLWAGWSMALGTVLFSGSLYALALTGIKWFGPITPLGGLCFIGGWLLLVVALLKTPGDLF